MVNESFQFDGGNLEDPNNNTAELDRNKVNPETTLPMELSLNTRSSWDTNGEIPDVNPFYTIKMEMPHDFMVS